MAEALELSGALFKISFYHGCLIPIPQSFLQYEHKKASPHFDQLLFRSIYFTAKSDNTMTLAGSN